MDHTQHQNQDLKKTALSATLHCLTGCAIGEIMGMALGAHFGWPNIETIIVSIILAFFFGYLLSIISLTRSSISLRKAIPLALAADTISITVMEIVDNLVMFLIPGAMDAHLTSFFFWASLGFALFIAFVVAYPVNMYLISKNKGHALIHKHH